MASLQIPIEQDLATGMSDQELLERFVAGRDQAAFARLVERHGKTIWAVCRRVLQKEHDAEDAYQAAFIVLSRKAASIRRKEAVGSWLYSVAYRIAMKARKSLQRRKVAEQPAEAVARDQPPCSEASIREMQRILDEEVDRLSDKHRAPFVLCCLEGMSKPEAARELGWPEPTVKDRLAQARKLLQARLARRGITLSAVLTALALAQSSAAAAPVVLAASEGATVSASALSLAESFTSGIVMTKAKTALACVLLLSTTVTAAALTAQFNSDDLQPENPKPVAEVKGFETLVAPAAPLLKPHDEQVLALAFSPNGKRLATAGARHTLPGQFMVWDTENRTELVRLRGMRGIRGIAFSPDGKTVACGAFAGTVTLRDADTGKERAVLSGHKIGVNAVAYSADGNWLVSAGLDKIVKLWDLQNLTESKAFVGHTDMVFTVAYFRHGKAIVSGGKDRIARIWDIDSGKVKFDLACPAAVEAVAISPDDKIVAAGCWDHSIRLWNADTGKQEAVLPATEGMILAVAFSHDGSLLASSSNDGTVRLWDVKTRRTLKKLAGHSSAIWSISFANQSTILATGSTDRTAKLWDVATGAKIATLTTAEVKAVRSVAYTPDGKMIAVAAGEKNVHLRDSTTGELKHVLKGHADLVHAVAVSPDGTTLASGSADKTIKIWNAITGKEVRTLNGHAGAVFALAFAKDGKLASAGGDKLVRWWDLADGKEPITLRGHEAAVRALAFSPDGTTLASGGDDLAVRIWNAGKQEAQRVLSGHGARVRALAFAPNGALASASDDATVKVWDVAAEKPKLNLAGYVGPVRAIGFTPGAGALVSAGTDKHVIVWDAVTGKQRSILPEHKAPVTALAIHPNGHDVITGSDDGVLLRWRSSAVPTGVDLDAVKDPAAAKPAADFEVSLKKRPDNLPMMSLEGKNAQKFVRFAPDGMRITIPPGVNGMDARVSFNAGMGLKGDFEVAVNYEILHLPEDADAGRETGVTMSVWRHKGDICIAGVTRRVVESRGSQFSGWATWFERIGEPFKHEEQLTDTKAKSGRLKVVRRGEELFCFASERLDGEFKTLNQLRIGASNLDDVRLIGFTGNPRASLDARLWDLRISTREATGAATRDAQQKAATSTNARTRTALTVVILLVGVLVVIAGLVLLVLLRRRHTSAKPPKAGASPPPSILFACACGKSLKANAAARGKNVKCPKCGKLVLVPASTGVGIS